MATNEKLGDLHNWTKTDLARVVLQALCNTEKPLPADHFKVRRMMQRSSKIELIENCERAIEVLSARAVR